MSGAPTDWQALGDLRTLLDPEAVVALCTAAGMGVVGVEPDYLRLKVGESATVGYRATVLASTNGGVDSLDGAPGPRVEPLHVRTFADTLRAAAIVDKWEGRKLVGNGVALVGSSIVFSFPNDGELRGLRHAVTPHGWRRLLRESTTPTGEPMHYRGKHVEIVRYKPGRRVVGRVTMRHRETDETLDAFFRYFGTPVAPRLAVLSSMLGAAGVPVPQLIASGYDNRLVIEELVSGTSATSRHRDGLLDLNALLAAVRQLHGVTSTVGGTGRTETVLTSDAAIAEAIDALDAIAVIAPSLAEEVLRVAVTLRTSPRPATSTVRLHGDLHLDQFLIDGSRITIVDLERSTLGAPGYDLGCLAGHLVELACRAGHHPPSARIIDELRASWTAVGGSPDDLHPVFACTGLVRRALLAVRTFDPRVPDLAASLLHAAALTIDAPRFVTLHLRPKGVWTALVRTEHGTASAVLGTGGAVIVDADGDPTLVGLPAAQQRGRLVAHRPGRRAVIAAESGSFLKVVSPDRSALLAHRHELVHDRLQQVDGVRSPAVITVDAALGIVELEAMGGTPLVDTLANDTAAARRAAIERAAEVLSRLATIDLSGGGSVPTSELPAAGDGGANDQWAAVAAGLYPSLALLHRPAVSLLDALFMRLATVHTARPAAFSHGDFHDKNLMLAADHAAIIDLDAAGVGDPLVDQGNLIAHVGLRALQRGDSPQVARAEASILLDSLGQVADSKHHAAHGSADVYVAAVRVHTARTLHRLSVVYRCRARWAYLAPVLLNESWHWAAAAASHFGIDAIEHR